MLDLELYGGQQIKLAFHAEDPTTDDGLWYGWFIDNLYIGNATEGIRFAGSDLRSSSSPMRNKLSAPEITITQVSLSRAIQTGAKNSEPSLAVVPATTRSNDRPLQGYKVWRLQAGNEANQSSWTLLTPQSITTLSHLDTGWESLPNGNYRWAVKALYTADVASVPSFSNIIPRETLMGNIVGFVRKTNNQPIAGAVVTAGTQSATTNTAGAYSLALPVGVYSVTGTAANYLPRTYDGIAVSPNENTTLNIVLSGVANEDDILPVTATELAGNYPNPFNPETTISYAIKDGCFVSLEVYNLKGQMVRSLIKRDMEQGRHSVVFNGKDDLGKPLASGIYMYRLKAGSYSSTRKMMLME